MFRFKIRGMIWLTAVATLAGGLDQESRYARAEEPPFDCRSVIQAATSVLEKEHYSRRKLDNDLSEQWFKAFFAEADPRRMYFLQSDISDLQPFAHLMDDHAKSGDFEFPELVRKRYRERVIAAAADASKLIDAHHDFTLDESLPLRFNAYAKTAEELRERWRLLIKSELLVEKAHGRPLAEVRSHLHSRYERIATQARELTDRQLCQVYLDSLLKLYDSHSGYFDDSASLSGPSYGLGLSLREEAGRYLIVGVRPGLRNDDTLALIGWELMAIKRTSGEILDLMDSLPREKVFEVIRSPIGPLESDNRVVLELLNPVTLQRKSVNWTRLRY